MIRYGFSLVCALLLCACAATVPQLGKSVYWRGKPAVAFFERYRMPDISLGCLKDGRLRNIYGFNVAVYDVRDYEVGRSRNTVFMERHKVHTGTEMTVVFADENDIITSIGTHLWGDIEKQYGCGSHARPHIEKMVEGLDKRPVKPRIWRALSMDEASESTRAYESGLHRSEEQAKAEALQKCRGAGGRKCVAWQWFSNVCIGTATGNKNGRSLAYIGSGLEAGDADAMALKECARHAKSCATFRPAACAVPCDAVRDKNCMYGQPLFGLHGMTKGKAVPFGLMQ